MGESLSGYKAYEKTLEPFFRTMPWRVGRVGRVATAVREFDRTAPGRRWLQRLGRETRFRHWLYTRLGLWLSNAWIFWLVVAAVLIFVLLEIRRQISRRVRPRPLRCKVIHRDNVKGSEKLSPACVFLSRFRKSFF